MGIWTDQASSLSSGFSLVRNFGPLHGGKNFHCGKCSGSRGNLDVGTKFRFKRRF